MCMVPVTLDYLLGTDLLGLGVFILVHFMNGHVIISIYVMPVTLQYFD